MAWKTLCEKHAYRRLSNESDTDVRPGRSPSAYNYPYQPLLQFPNTRPQNYAPPLATTSAPDLTTSSLHLTSRIKGRVKHTSYRTQFKRRYMVETAWRNGGRVQSRQITPDQGVVTSLHLTDKYIVVALDNAKIHVFDSDGAHQKTLHGHVMGVWAMVPWGDVLVSGGCDREVRVWNMATG